MLVVSVKILFGKLQNKMNDSTEFLNEIYKTIDYFRHEFELPYKDVISSLEIAKLDMWKEMNEEAEEKKE